MFKNIKNIVLGLVLLGCIIFIAIFLFGGKGNGKPEEYTGRPLPIQNAASESLATERLREMKMAVPREGTQKRENNGENRRPKMAPPGIAKKQTEAIAERKKRIESFLEKEKKGEVDSSLQKRIDEIREERAKQAKKKARDRG